MTILNPAAYRASYLKAVNPLLKMFKEKLHHVLLTRLFGATGIVLVVVASFYHPEGADRRQLILRHLFSPIIIVLAIVFALYVKKRYRSQLGKITEEMRRLNTDLEAKVEQRTEELSEALSK